MPYRLAIALFLNYLMNYTRSLSVLQYPFLKFLRIFCFLYAIGATTLANHTFQDTKPGKAIAFPGITNHTVKSNLRLHLKQQITIAGHRPYFLSHQHFQCIYRRTKCVHGRHHTLHVIECLLLGTGHLLCSSFCFF